MFTRKKGDRYCEDSLQECVQAGVVLHPLAAYSLCFTLFKEPDKLPPLGTIWKHMDHYWNKKYSCYWRSNNCICLNEYKGLVSMKSFVEANEGIMAKWPCRRRLKAHPHCVCCSYKGPCNKPNFSCTSSAGNLQPQCPFLQEVFYLFADLVRFFYSCLFSEAALRLFSYAPVSLHTWNGQTMTQLK